MQLLFPQAHTFDATYRSYSKQLSKLPVRSTNSQQSSSSLSSDNQTDFGMSHRSSSAVSAAGKERLTAHIVERQENKQKVSRRRMVLDSSDVDFINGKNEAFNKKIKKSFDKYTVEIRQNLERGTAI